MIEEGSDDLSRGVWVSELHVHVDSSKVTQEVFRPFPVTSGLLSWVRHCLDLPSAYPLRMRQYTSVPSARAVFHCHCLSVVPSSRASPSASLQSPPIMERVSSHYRLYRGGPTCPPTSMGARFPVGQPTRPLQVLGHASVYLPISPDSRYVVTCSPSQALLTLCCFSI